MPTRYQYQIAANNNNAAGLVNVETILATNETRYFRAPRARDKGVPGAPSVRLDGLGHRRGFPYVDWLWPITWLQYDYARTTWTPTATADGYSGYVTINSRLGGQTYTHYNAILFIPAMDSAGDGYGGFRQIVFHFTHLVAIA